MSIGAMADGVVSLAAPAMYFTGGTVMSVSYPTSTMDYEARIQSMRGNNPGFSHATAFHEMIPGHNLVGYMAARFNDYRANLIVDEELRERFAALAPGVQLVFISDSCHSGTLSRFEPPGRYRLGPPSVRGTAPPPLSPPRLELAERGEPPAPPGTVGWPAR